MWRCPKCGSSRIDQFRMLYGPMWWLDCGFRVEHKTIDPNPFFVEEEEQATPEQAEHDCLSMGEQMLEWLETKRRGEERKGKVGKEHWATGAVGGADNSLSPGPPALD